MTQSSAWLETMWPLVREHLPAAPAHGLEIGCGAAGGFVPMLEEAGYVAVGVDPDAPEGPQFIQALFQDADLPDTYDVVIACTSLHHVAEPAAVVDRMAEILRSDGTAIVVEWVWEELDEATASWAFDRLAPDADSWLNGRRADWQASGRGWDAALTEWAEAHGIHRAIELVGELDRRFRRRHFARGPYCFSGIPGTSASEEQAAIGAGRVRATRIDYVGVRRSFA